MEDSIFTKIINGDIPSHKIYEDDKTFAFLDIHPKTSGHVLVISRAQVEHIWELPEADYSAVMATVRKVALRLRQILHPEHVGVQIEGLDVPHAHVHVFPFASHSDFHNHPDMQAEPDHQALSEMAQKLAF